ncbi:MAG: hypothetical protein H7330_15550 [Hymenobacteraceae bacterium]|nr:hypothetical protein [Hymenobacteraceae bacterium]
MPVTFFDFHHLPQPDQTRLLAAHGRLLATRREGGIRQHLYDLRGFFVETWHWAEDEHIGLLFSFTDVAQLDGWLEGVEVGDR